MAYVARAFAIESGILTDEKLCRTVDCTALGDDADAAERALFGESGMALIVDGADMLHARLRGRLCEDSENQSRPLLVVTTDISSPASAEFHGRFPITIELPPLEERPLEERFELLQRFLNLEAARAKKTLTINSEIMCCLLLYDCQYNVMQLKGDVKTACAAAFVRSFSTAGERIELFMGDFEYYVRKGFLNYRRRRGDVERLVKPAVSYSFGESNVVMSPMDRDKLLYSDNMYEDLERKARELRQRGLSDKDVISLIGSEMEANFNTYRAALSRQAVNREQLAKLVDKRVLELTESFLDEASRRFSKIYPASVFYGLCLHINAVIKRERTDRCLPAAKINAVLGHYRE